ncbi:MAG: HAMP domain-containing protein [Actinobacteria bacterium]|nr:HAMP domain-containing protein [Actinomycetota bacterium]
MSENAEKSQKRKGSRILLQITLIVLVVFVISSGLSLFFYIRSTRELSNKSKDKVIETEAENLSSGFEFVTKMVGREMMERFEESVETQADYTNAIMTKAPTPSMLETNQVLKDLADEGLLGVETLFVVLEAMPPTVSEPLIIEASDENLFFEGVPQSMMDIIESGEPYGYLEDGVAEWDLEGDQLFVYYSVGDELTQGVVKMYAAGVKSLEEDFAEINDYYNKETKKINVLMGIIILSSLVVLVLITFFIFSYLIHTRITKPIEELSDAAEHVREGDLDVEVPVTKGEEFENLKQVFNEMLDSIRKLMGWKSDKGNE